MNPPPFSELSLLQWLIGSKLVEAAGVTGDL